MFTSGVQYSISCFNEIAYYRKEDITMWLTTSGSLRFEVGVV